MRNQTSRKTNYKSKIRWFLIYSIIEAIVAVFSAVEVFLIHGSGYFIILLMSTVLLLIITVQAGHSMIRIDPDFPPEKAKVPYPLFDSVMVGISGIIYIILVFYFGPKFPNVQWPADLFAFGVLLLFWSIVLLFTKILKIPAGRAN